MRPTARLFVAFAAIAAAVACESRLDGLTGVIGQPPIVIEANDFVNLSLVAVNDTALPRSTRNAGTIYTIVSGSFSLHGDSTWLFSTLESLSTPNGDFIGNSPANYTGTWRVTDTTITLLPTYGTATIKGDTIFWRNGPRHGWEDSIEFTLIRK